MAWNLIVWIILAFVCSFLFTLAIKRIALRLGVVDSPDNVRKIHKEPVPLLGGTAIFITMAIFIIGFLLFSESLTGGEITKTHYLGFLLGGIALVAGGYFDDRYNLKPQFSILFPITASLVIIFFGIEVDKLTNPFGGIVYLKSWQSDILVFIWLMIVMYTTKFLDGLDGLSGGVSGIGAFMIMLLSSTAAYFQPDVALLSALSIGAIAGFLVLNFHPAKIFLGEGGSTFVGFLLGSLAIISGGKLAIALVVLALPLFDTAWVILRRMFVEKRLPVIGDRKHLHHRLLDIGFLQKQIVLSYYFVAASLGLLTLFLQSRQKLVLFGASILLLVIAALFIVFVGAQHDESKQKGKPKA
ncbi:MAG: hypothetical protein ACD_76C00029G0005 [uncultured bacterium]|nr:MAG: hypothetical protein ACD_76C00029G0005 [uncultured bacterium]